jgi:hypothetical protein
MKQMAKAGQLAPSDMVLQEGKGTWMPASQVQALFPLASAHMIQPAGSRQELSEREFSLASDGSTNDKQPNVALPSSHKGIHFRCPTCHAAYESPQPGTKFYCTSCGQKVQVPSLPPSNKTVLGEIEALSKGKGVAVPPPLPSTASQSQSPHRSVLAILLVAGAGVILLSCLCGIVVVGVVKYLQPSKPKDLIVGKWEPSSLDDVREVHMGGAGATAVTLEFTKDGRMIVRGDFQGSHATVEGKYRVIDETGLEITFAGQTQLFRFSVSSTELTIYPAVQQFPSRNANLKRVK